MVPETGLEPVRSLGTRDFKSLASTNSATPAAKNSSTQVRKFASKNNNKFASELLHLPVFRASGRLNFIIIHNRNRFVSLKSGEIDSFLN
jgi:hypothetical protein